MATNPLKEIFHLFFPGVCPVCGEVMAEGSTIMCTGCMYDLPMTGYWLRRDNPVVEKLWGQFDFDNACSFFRFINESGYRKMIHMFKYQGSWRLAEQMGRWFGREMEEGGLYGNVDVVIPIPLHIFRRLKRGYNQSEYIAAGMAKELNRPMVKDCVVRHRYSKSQARSRRSERWDNVEGIFSVRHPERLAGKHILLVDDVLTTGATIISCAGAILRTVPDCRISVATLAVSKNELLREAAKKTK